MPLDLTLDLGQLEFHHPWLLLLALPALGAVHWCHRRRRRAPALVFPSVRRLAGLPRTWRQRALVLLPLLHGLGAILLVVAAARPREGDSRTVVRSEGIAIQMVLDRSGSMEDTMRYEGNDEKRIDIVKRVFRDFVTGGGDLAGRRTDLIGLTTFARFTEESCPLVSQHEPLLTAVENLTTVEPLLDRYGQPVPADRAPRRADPRKYQRNPLNATAIGDGLMRAVYSLVTAEEDLRKGEEEGGYKIQGKVIIILTDGDDNASEIPPAEAGRYARENGIRIYYILMRELNDYQWDLFSGRRVVVRTHRPDELLAAPREVAGSGDRAFLATDGDALRRIYEQIDQLERTEIGRIEYRSYEEKFHVFLLPGVALILLAILLGETVLRRTP